MYIIFRDGDLSEFYVNTRVFLNLGWQTIKIRE